MRIRLLVFGLLSSLFTLTVRSQIQEEPAVSDSLPAKPVKPLKLGISLTGSSYRGDLDNTAFNFTRFYPGLNFSMQLDGEKPLRIQFNAGYGQFAEEYDQGTQPTADSSTQSLPFGFQGVAPFVQTAFFYADLRLRYRIFRTARFEAFTGAGVGFLMFSPRDKNGKFLSETNLNRLTGESYNTLVAQFPVNVGFQYRFSPALALGLDYTYRLTPSDYLDNVSKLGNKGGNDALHMLAATVYLSIREAPKLPAIFRDTTEDLRPLEAALKIEEVIAALPGDSEDRDPSKQADLYEREPLTAEDPAHIRLLTGFYPSPEPVAGRTLRVAPEAFRATPPPFRLIPLPSTPREWMGNTIEDDAPEFGHTPLITPMEVPATPESPTPTTVAPPVTAPVVAAAPAERPQPVLTALEQAALQAVKEEEVMYYHPKRGDKLSELSQRFHIPVEAIRIANGLPPTATAPPLGVYLKLPDLRKYYESNPAESDR